MRFFSFLLSLILHVVIIGVVFFIPYRSKPINLKTMTYQVELVTLPQVKKKVEIKKKALTEKIPKRRASVLLPKKVIEKRPVQLRKRKLEVKIKKRSLYFPSKEKILENILKEVKKEAKKEEELEKRLSKEISELQKEVSKKQSSGKTSLSLDESVYKEAVKNIIKKNWRLVPSKSLEGLNAEVKLLIDKQGNIVDYFFIKRSGNFQFDTSVAKAIAETKRLPVPPFDIKYVIIRFDAKELL